MSSSFFYLCAVYGDISNNIFVAANFVPPASRRLHGFCIRTIPDNCITILYVLLFGQKSIHCWLSLRVSLPSSPPAPETNIQQRENCVFGPPTVLCHHQQHVNKHKKPNEAEQKIGTEQTLSVRTRKKSLNKTKQNNMKWHAMKSKSGQFDRNRHNTHTRAPCARIKNKIACCFTWFMAARHIFSWPTKHKKHTKILRGTKIQVRCGVHSVDDICGRTIGMGAHRLAQQLVRDNNKRPRTNTLRLAGWLAGMSKRFGPEENETFTIGRCVAFSCPFYNACRWYFFFFLFITFSFEFDSARCTLC